ncbi:hypothetical protein K469DRAFT_748726 [Zopfia rhizophila CBS 207.26]|uniref:U6 small nuclear RNA (adenine-(43)-N(6))-methyltransferase n=1 Tax=Zopfia rhizophila CBS 207.26 TaxID=1314779 RepID=A0A6A6E7F1_9PEZI|nr:hypothetical protein K469DRAFT_748726 [Zopfia rhizophila CBS 207.26]
MEAIKDDPKEEPISTGSTTKEFSTNDGVTKNHAVKDSTIIDNDLSQLPHYDAAIDFKALAKNDENFKKISEKSKGFLNFQDPETMQILTKAIVKVDFGLHIDLPDDRLCPPVPIRWNYVSWVQSLIDTTGPDYTQTYDPTRQVMGLDIGTGASAIYTLLLQKTRPNWNMCATDIDKKSFDSAVRNLALNGMITRTRLLQTMEGNAVIPLNLLGVERLDFTICNPPFFADEKEMRASLKGERKSWAPNSVCTGNEVEMICPGGDIGFVTRIIEESLLLRDKVTWYSSMLGKLESAKAVVDKLKKNGVNNWAVGCLDAGGLTKRWVVAWSFGDFRPRNDIARIDNIAHEYLPFPTEYKIDLDSSQDILNVIENINSHLSSLALRWQWKPGVSTGVGIASQNVWKRAFRREQQKKKKAMKAGRAEENMKNSQEEERVVIAFKIHVLDEPAKEGVKAIREVKIQWLRGTDLLLWESFCGMLHRLVREVK